MEIHIQVFLVYTNKCFFSVSDKKNPAGREGRGGVNFVYIYMFKKKTRTAKMMMFPNSAGIKSAYCSERSKSLASSCR